MVVTAQPTVSAMILTPWADRKEGGQVDMRCTATDLESDHIVAWLTEEPEYDSKMEYEYNIIQPTVYV